MDFYIKIQKSWEYEFANGLLIKSFHLKVRMSNFILGVVFLVKLHNDTFLQCIEESTEYPSICSFLRWLINIIQWDLKNPVTSFIFCKIRERPTAWLQAYRDVFKCCTQNC